VIVGIQPDVAYAMVALGMSTGAVSTALDLEDGLALLDALLRGAVPGTVAVGTSA
jgi:rsbT antagonist protein RsbS